MAAVAIWKIEKLQYLSFGGVSRSSQPRQHLKFYAFKNSTWWPIAICKYKKHDISKIIYTYFSRILVR